MKNTNLLIEKMLDSTIDEEERIILKSKILTKPSLIKEVEFRKEVNNLVLEDDIMQLRQRLIQAKGAMEHNKILKKTYAKKVFYAAATITGITIGGWATFSGINQDLTANDLFKQNLKPYPPVGISRESSVVEAESMLFETMRLYQLEKFEFAAKGFEAILAENPERPIMKFYLGVTYLHLGEYGKSRNLLNDVIDNESILSDQAIWYKGLSYLAEDNIEEAISTLTKVSDTNSKLGKDASELLKNLKGI